MHGFNTISFLVVVTLGGVELSVEALEDPAAWRLVPAPQSQLLSRFAY